MNSNDLKKIKEIVEEFFQKATISAEIGAKLSLSQEKNVKEEEIAPPLEKTTEGIETVNIEVKTETPEILIGERGHTLLEVQRLLRIILNKKLGKNFYIDLDINDYKKKKVEYLKNLAKDLADEVVLTKEEKILFPMPAYERRIIHMELANRPDIITESQGEEPERRIVIKPRR